MKYLKIALLQVVAPAILAAVLVLGIGYAAIHTLGKGVLIDQYCEKVFNGK